MNSVYDEVTNYWRIICTVFMAMSTGAVLYGALPSISRTYDSNEFKLQDLVHILVWLHGLMGIFLCDLEDAFFKKVFTTISFISTTIALLWTLILDVVGKVNSGGMYPFNPDGNALLLLLSVSAWIFLFVYDIKKSRSFGKTSSTIEWVARTLLAFWLLLPMLLLGLISR